MNAQTTINSLTHFCKTTSGDPFIWLGNSGTYKWSRSKETNQGIINGVVRKLAAIDVNGNQIWVVAGSLKIDHDGSILRFTGLSKKMQLKIVESNPIDSQLINDVIIS